MSYRCGIGEGMRALGWVPGPPRMWCDGCGVTCQMLKRNGMPYQWFLALKAKPGWKKVWPNGEGMSSRDYCPACKDKVTST